jgi:hypothetical protein
MIWQGGKVAHNYFARTGSLLLRAQQRSDNPAFRRGREQTLHDLFNPPLNKINPISPTNPNLLQYLAQPRVLE